MHLNKLAHVTGVDWALEATPHALSVANLQLLLHAVAN